MVVIKYTENNIPELLTSSTARKRRLRRQKLHAARLAEESLLKSNQSTAISRVPVKYSSNKGCNLEKSKDNHLGTSTIVHEIQKITCSNKNLSKPVLSDIKMSSKESDNKSREEVLASRQAAKIAKQNPKNKNELKESPNKSKKKEEVHNKNETKMSTHKKECPGKSQNDSVKVEVKSQIELNKCNVPTSKIVVTKDEVDRAIIVEPNIVTENLLSKEQIKAERAAKKAAKQAKKKGLEESDSVPNTNLTVKHVLDTLNDIVNVAKEVQSATAKIQAIDLDTKKPDEAAKSKADLRAERRAKQEAQRAAKQATLEKKPSKSPSAAKSAVPSAKPSDGKPIGENIKEKSPKPKTLERVKTKNQIMNRVNWFQHLYTQHDKDTLKHIAVNSNLHPAIVKLGVQLATKVVTGSNARCIALLDALKKMVSDYTLPAKTEYARGLEAHLATTLDFLWSMRQPSASQTNAVKYFRHHLTQLPNNVDEFDAKKILQEEIDRYIKEQIDTAGKAISLTVRNKIANGDRILTFGCSSLIERILVEAWEEGVRFEAMVCGHRVDLAARHMLRRLTGKRLACAYLDITALNFLMPTVDKVLLGASALLVTGSVLGAVGTAQVALTARCHNVPVLVACETHKFSEQVLTDAFVYNEIGDPDELIDKSDPNSPLRDWRSNPNLTPLNLTYDVTPPSLITAVVTELAILPCTSAPVVLRFKLSEYGM